VSYQTAHRAAPQAQKQLSGSGKPRSTPIAEEVEAALKRRWPEEAPPPRPDSTRSV